MKLSATLVLILTFHLAAAGWCQTPNVDITPSVSQGTSPQVIPVELRISTAGMVMSVAKCTIEYDSTVVVFHSASIGSDMGSGYGVFVNTRPTWTPVSPEANRNVVIQARGGAFDSFQGDDLQMVVVNFRVVSQGCEISPLNIDRRCVSSALTTYDLQTVCYPQFGLTSGVIGTDCASDVPTPGRAQTIRLDQNLPNPFNPMTTIRFEIATPGTVQLQIFDVSGHRVRSLLGQAFEAGQHEVLWNGRNDAGVALPTGRYFYRLVQGSESKTRTMLLLK